MPPQPSSDGPASRTDGSGAPSDAARRRSAYGPTSADIGVRGQATRDRILGTALVEFGARGFHRTTIDDIAAATGVSRAAVYQYFESREAMFEELASGLGTDILRITRQLVAMGPTAEGYESLRDWVQKFSHLYQEQASVFIQWPDVMYGSERLRSLGATFNAAFARVLGQRLRDAGAHHDDLAVALAMLALVERASYLMATGRRARQDRQLLDMAAVTIQLALFPSTPRSVLPALS